MVQSAPSGKLCTSVSDEHCTNIINRKVRLRAQRGGLGISYKIDLGLLSLVSQPSVSVAGTEDVSSELASLDMNCQKEQRTLYHLRTCTHLLTQPFWPSLILCLCFCNPVVTVVCRGYLYSVYVWTKNKKMLQHLRSTLTAREGPSRNAKVEA
jgi:hypothetical protein